MKFSTERTDYFAAAAGLVAALVAALVIDLRFGAAVLAGAGVGVLNFSLMRMLVGAILSGGSGRGRAVALLLLKVVALMGTIYIAVGVISLPVVAFGLGFMSTPVALVIDGLIWQGQTPSQGVEQQGELR